MSDSMIIENKIKRKIKKAIKLGCFRTNGSFNESKVLNSAFFNTNVVLQPLTIHF